MDAVKTQRAASRSTAVDLLSDQSGVALSLPTALQGSIAEAEDLVVPLLPRHRFIKARAALIGSSFSSTASSSALGIRLVQRLKAVGRPPGPHEPAAA